MKKQLFIIHKSVKFVLISYNARIITSVKTCLHKLKLFTILQLPTKVYNKLSLLKSPHVHKKAQNQAGIVVYKLILIPKKVSDVTLFLVFQILKHSRNIAVTTNATKKLLFKTMF